MQPKSRIILATLFAVAWTGLASAETPNTHRTQEIGALDSVIEMHLDVAFEKSAKVGDEELVPHLTGPTSMDCTNAEQRTNLETCVVTAAGTPQTMMPAALAQH